MSRRKQRVHYYLDSGGIKKLDFTEIEAILRAADELIATRGRTMLSKILKGSKDKKLMNYLVSLLRGSSLNYIVLKS